MLSRKQLAGFNAWLGRRIAARAGSVQAVHLTQDPDGQAVATACLLARCGTRFLTLGSPSPALLNAACTTGSLTSIWLDGPEGSLNPLELLPQLLFLRVDSFSKHMQGNAPPAWRPSLPALAELVVESMRPCTISLDGCSMLGQVSILCADGLVLAASRPLLHLTRLALWHLNDLEVPWQRLPALRELVLQRNNGGELLEGATQLTSLRNLHFDCSTGFELPPGDCLAGITRLVLEDCDAGKVGGGMVA